MHWNLQNQGIISFPVFLQQFEELLVKSICEKAKQISEEVKEDKTLFNEDVIAEILFQRFAPEYLEIFAKDTLYSLINDEDYIYVSDEQKPELIEIWNEFLSKGLKSAEDEDD